jgi:hypothetical protein
MATSDNSELITPHGQCFHFVFSDDCEALLVSVAALLMLAIALAPFSPPHSVLLLAKLLQYFCLSVFPPRAAIATTAGPISHHLHARLQDQDDIVRR